MKKIGILGTGVMGVGIAQIAAQTDHEVLFWNRKEDSVERGLKRLEKGLERLVKKERISQSERDETWARVRGTSTLEELKVADVVIEAVPEDTQVKLDLFARLHAICSDDVIFASNTSSLSITQLARDSGRPEHFLGMHFFNPVPAMKLVELVRGLATSDETVERTRSLALAMNKIPLDVKDYPGFVVNRVVMPMINEAVFALEQGVGDAKTIDECMKLGCNHPMGPLALADLVGLDIVLAILESLHREFGDPRYRPCSLLRKKVEAGWLGSKTGRGFYTY
ncbi:MAG: 3-hydroxyacyl-CoA dehydrogenase NAD-binding domain-containing protein [Myxococcota bacterium]